MCVFVCVRARLCVCVCVYANTTRGLWIFACPLPLPPPSPYPPCLLFIPLPHDARVHRPFLSHFHRSFPHAVCPIRIPFLLVWPEWRKGRTGRKWRKGCGEGGRCAPSARRACYRHAKGKQNRPKFPKQTNFSALVHLMYNATVEQTKP